MDIVPIYTLIALVVTEMCIRDRDWDLNIQQFSITDERKNAVDFTSPYYTTTSAIITKAGSPAASATSIADLKDVLIGVQAGTTSQQFA